jgi:hypothetical protein
MWNANAFTAFLFRSLLEEFRLNNDMLGGRAKGKAAVGTGYPRAGSD